MKRRPSLWALERQPLPAESHQVSSWQSLYPSAWHSRDNLRKISPRTCQARVDLHALSAAMVFCGWWCQLLRQSRWPSLQAKHYNEDYARAPWPSPRCRTVAKRDDVFSLAELHLQMALKVTNGCLWNRMSKLLQKLLDCTLITKQESMLPNLSFALVIVGESCRTLPLPTYCNSSSSS